MQAPNVYDAEPIPASAKAEIERLLQSGDLFRYTAASGSPVAELESEFAAMMGSKYALAVASCSSALFLTMKALDLPRGAKVIIPAFTFGAVPSSIVHADCVPVLVECADNYRIDIEDFKKKFTDDIACIIISHMRGHTSDMDILMKLAAEKNVPVIEDAAHSLGTLWNGKKIGTIGRVGCFSFQSYKLVNAGEGGIMITDDDELFARAVIMSGAYEHTWKKHAGVLEESVKKWQNKLPLYNTRLQNLSAAVIRPQLAEVPRRVRDGRRNHDYLAEKLNTCKYFDVPPPLPQEERAPDSIQFNLKGLSDDQVHGFVAAAHSRGLTSVKVFGMTQDNARAFWNWGFIPDQGELPQTRAMLMRAADCRLPARLKEPELDFIAEALTECVKEVTTEAA